MKTIERIMLAMIIFIIGYEIYTLVYDGKVDPGILSCLLLMVFGYVAFAYYRRNTPPL